MLLTTKETKQHLNIIQTGKVSSRKKSLIALFENYILDHQIDKDKYPLHVWYLVRFDGATQNDRFFEKYCFDAISRSAQVTLCADLLGLTSGADALEKAMLTEVLSALSSIAKIANDEGSTFQEACNIVNFVNNASMLHPRDIIAFVKDISQNKFIPPVFNDLGR